MFERSGIVKRSVAGILPSSTSMTNHKLATPLGYSQLMDMACSNQRLHGGLERACAPGEDKNKRTSGHLGRHMARLKRLKVAESEVKKSSGGSAGGVGGQGGWGGKGIRGGEGKESAASELGSDKGGDGDERTAAAPNTSKDQNKLLMSDSSGNSEEEWNDDSDEDNGVGQMYTSPSSFKHRPHQHRGKTEVSKKKSSKQESASKKKQEEDLDVDGGEECMLLQG